MAAGKEENFFVQMSRPADYKQVTKVGYKLGLIVQSFALRYFTHFQSIMAAVNKVFN